MQPKAGTPAPSSLASAKEMEISDREREIIGLITDTPHLFIESENWSYDCTEANHLLVGQVLAVRSWIQRKVLSLEFMQDYVQHVLSGAATRAAGKTLWWARCTVDLFLKGLKAVRRDLYSFVARVSMDVQEALTQPGDTEDLKFRHDMQGSIYSSLHMLPWSDLSTSELKALSTPPPRGISQDPIDRAGETERRAMQGIMVVMNCSAVEDQRAGCTQAVTQEVRQDVLSWLQQFPRLAEQLIQRIPNFRFWFGINSEIMELITRDAAHIQNARASRRFVTNRLQQGWY
jgi:hypothetical protein